MSETPNFDPNFKNIENLGRRIDAIRKVQADLFECLERNEMLMKFKSDISQRFAIRGYENDIVPTSHYRIGLVPAAREPVLYGAARVEVGIPIYSPRTAGDVPRPFIAIYEEMSGKQPSDGSLIPGNDIFMDVLNASGKLGGRYLLNPEGIYTYRTAEDIVPAHAGSEDSSPETLFETMYPAQPGVIHDHLFTVDTAVSNDALFQAEYEWGVFAIVDAYEPALINNIRRSN
jgi:hypothetical protein